MIAGGIPLQADDVVKIIGVAGAAISFCVMCVTIGVVRYHRGQEAITRANRLAQDLSNLGYAAKNSQDAAEKWREQERALAKAARDERERKERLAEIANADGTPYDPEMITP